LKLGQDGNCATQIATLIGADREKPANQIKGAGWEFNFDARPAQRLLPFELALKMTLTLVAHVDNQGGVGSCRQDTTSSANLWPRMREYA